MPQRQAQALFITGTDTGVGKTIAAVLLARALVARGKSVGVYKPLETGCARDPATQELIPADGLLLQRAAGGRQPLTRVSPFRFADPIAPGLAVEMDGTPVTMGTLRTQLAKLRDTHDYVLVEGAGGLLVPALPGHTMAEVAYELEIPIVVVARAGLGTINHTLLTLEAAYARDLRVTGVILNQTRDPEHFPPGPDEPLNGPVIEHMSGMPIVGRTPWVADPFAPAPAEIEDWVQIDRLFAEPGA